MMLGGCRIIQKKKEVIEGNSVQLEIVTRNVLDLQDLQASSWRVWK